MKGKKTTKRRSGATKTQSNRPRILVLEGVGGSATNAVMRSGAMPVRVSPTRLDDVDAALAAGRFHALLLTGGGDLSPDLYGDRKHAKVYGVNQVRDYAEWTALDRAAELGVPVMGICRGMQMIAVHNGGRLRQHVEDHRGTTHAVMAAERSAFRVLIDRPYGRFPSLHHQLVRRTGPGMRVSGRSPEGYIEAIESTDRRVLGVQFHPEYDYGTNEASRRLFDWLAQAAAQFAGLPQPQRSAVGMPTQLLGARSVTSPARRPARGVRYGFFCRDCGLRFDKQQDRDDHEYWVCGTPELRVAEPPPGHPDWMGAA